jgi:xanthine/uracil/vitamin C permease (AzgA family)
MTISPEIRTINNPPAGRTTTSSHEVAADQSSRRLLGLTSTLLALQVLNLAVFDDLRTDTSLAVLETFTKPQHLSSIVAVLLAVILVARRHRHAARVAVVVAWIEVAAFTFFHGIPVQIGPAKPYWGDGSGDALQWLGFLSIMACSVAIIVVGRKRSTTATPTASTHPDGVEVMP